MIFDPPQQNIFLNPEITLSFSNLRPPLIAETNVSNIGGKVISTINISDILSSDDNISFDWDNISITPTLWKEALPDVDTVNAMCNEYPALAKAYENFQTVYKLVEQDYKGKEEDNT